MAKVCEPGARASTDAPSVLSVLHATVPSLKPGTPRASGSTKIVTVSTPAVAAPACGARQKAMQNEAARAGLLADLTAFPAPLFRVGRVRGGHTRTPDRVPFFLR